MKSRRLLPPREANDEASSLDHSSTPEQAWGGRSMSQWVESRMGAVAWAFGHRPVSHPRSSNRTCRFPASGFPAGFTARHAPGPLGAGVGGTERRVLDE